MHEKSTPGTDQLISEIRHLVRMLIEQNKPSNYPTHNLDHFSVEEVSAILGCSQNSVRNIIRDNELKTFKYKSILRIRKSHLERFINKHTA
jgi:excisionase family DNA binding protein